MKTENSPADAHKQRQQDDGKTAKPENQQPVAAQPPLSESPKSQMNVYQQLREMDNELAKNKSDSNAATDKPAE